MKKIIKWWIANTTNKPVWNVSYNDGRVKRLIPYKEAKQMMQMYRGKIWIDYENGVF